MRKAFVQLVVLGVAIGVVVTLVAVRLQWLPTSASAEFDRIQDIYWFATVVSIVIFSLVAAIVIYAVWKWRVAPDDDLDGPPIHGNTTLEIVWTVIPALIVIVLGVVSAVVLSENGQASAKPLQVKVIGQQFAWKFQYPELGQFSTGELVLPVDEQAQFTMDALDVIHSFWVPEFGQKMDAVPGIETKILVTPTRTGEFAVVCTELCGLGHATMRAKARVVSRTDFDKWIEEQKA